VVYSFCGLTLKDIRKLQKDNTKLKNKLRKPKESPVESKDITATELLRRQEERLAEQSATLQVSADAIAEAMVKHITSGMEQLEREADKVSKLMEDIKLLQDSEAALRNEVVILQKINIESAGQILELESKYEDLEQDLIAANEAWEE
jgi:chromosome segregation ATPase